MKYKEDVAYLVKYNPFQEYEIVHFKGIYVFFREEDEMYTIEEFEKNHTVIGECSQIESIVKLDAIRAGNQKGTYIKEGYREWGM